MGWGIGLRVRFQSEQENESLLREAQAFGAIVIECAAS